MIEYYKTIDGEICKLESLQKDTWVNVVSPTNEDIDKLINDLKIEKTFISAALDEEESPHIDVEGDQMAVIVDIPNRTVEDDGIVKFNTIPLSIIIKEDIIITICMFDSPIIRDFTDNLVKGIDTKSKMNLMFKIFYKMSQIYLSYLKQIDKMINYAETQLQKSMKNKELFHMMAIEKSLVYFSTSLKANEVTMEKILSGRRIKLYDKDEKELLDDVLIEVRQAIEMSSIYRDILGGEMDAYASIISNNLNIVMKVLTSITIIMAIPTMIAGFYGMNVPDLPFPTIWFPVLITVLICVIVGILLKVKNLL